MTPKNKIRREILLDATQSYPEEFQFGPLDTDGQVNGAYEKLIAAGCHWDYESEYRDGQYETGLPCEWSRHYETKSVAMKTSDGSYVGWTFWFGGGKHGNPESIPWMDDAYDLEVTEEEKMVVVRTFKRVGQ